MLKVSQIDDVIFHAEPVQQISFIYLAAGMKILSSVLCESKLMFISSSSCQAEMPAINLKHLLSHFFHSGFPNSKSWFLVVQQ